jgi:hypothetical protein
LRQAKGIHDIADAHLALEQHSQNGLARFVGQSFAKVYAVNHNRRRHGVLSQSTYIDNFQYVNIIPQIGAFVKPQLVAFRNVLECAGVLFGQEGRRA